MTSPGLLGVRSLVADSWRRCETCGVRPDGSQLLSISGMPILDVDKAKSVAVIKRSMGHGYAGIDNELYTNPKTGMFYSDAKKGLAELKAAVREFVG
ncbi:NAD(P)(+) transhydrogenase (Re/Si-specific) subunit beta [Streptomyces sp. NBC_00457]|uniref:NAD(P)(+) transhydrogenase (Re/Si-specific) subunit beta n=1 Tax=Streptomyces sp. NBC_00457 TaxID=2975748 RepID=UPI002E20A317